MELFIGNPNEEYAQHILSMWIFIEWNLAKYPSGKVKIYLFMKSK